MVLPDHRRLSRSRADADLHPLSWAHRLSFSNLGVTGDVDVLRTVRDQLHEPSTHLVCFNKRSEKKMAAGAARRRRGAGAPRRGLPWTAFPAVFR